MRKRILALLLIIALCLTGCSMRTLDQMYCLPKRSEDHKELRVEIEKAMVGLAYCAPSSGENQQTLHTVDLDGDETPEYLLYARGGSERPLRILIFDEIAGVYTHVTTIEANGSGFDMVEYASMESGKGKQIVFGCQISDQPLRSLAVYRYANGQAERLLAANYSKFLTVDLDADSLAELFVLRPGNTDADNGVAELYGMENGAMERSNEVNMSQPVDMLKRIIFSKLNDGEPAVYVASSVEDTALITDVYVYQESALVNVSLSSESGTSVKTLRNYYVYADDIDNDGSVELPALISMVPVQGTMGFDRHNLIRWYSLKLDGSEVDKLYTYHNFVGRWYLALDSSWASYLTVQQQANAYDFYVWSADFQQCQKVFTVHALTDVNRDSQSTQDGRFVLLKTDSTTFCATLYDSAQNYAITRDSVTRSFRLIESEWKTGET